MIYLMRTINYITSNSILKNMREERASPRQDNDIEECGRRVMGSDLDETGWDRVKALFNIRYGEDIPQEVRDFPTTVLLASFTGFLFGGMIGARHAGDKFIALNHSSKFTSVMQAQRELHGAAMLGFVSKGARWGWKMGVFAGIFSGSNILLSAYRNKEDALNYIAAGAVTGGLFRVSAGLKPTIGGMVLGTLISIPLGLLMHGLDLLLVGSKGREQIRRERYLARRRREEQWHAKLNSTSALIEDLQGDLESPSSSPSGLQNYYTTPASDNSSEDHSSSSHSECQVDSSDVNPQATKSHS